MARKLIMFFALGVIFLLLNGDVSFAAQGYGSYENGVRYPGLRIYQNNNGYYNNCGYKKSVQITEEREQDSSGQTMQLQEMKQWLDDHPGQRDNVQHVFQAQ